MAFYLRRAFELERKMTFVTRLRLESGDRARLDAVVDEIRETAERKGAAMKGPHSHPPTDLRVPQHRALENDNGQFDPWNYTVYNREIELVGRDDLAGQIAYGPFPDGVHVEVEIERVTSA